MVIQAHSTSLSQRGNLSPSNNQKLIDHLIEKCKNPGERVNFIAEMTNLEKRGVRFDDEKKVEELFMEALNHFKKFSRNLEEILIYFFEKIDLNDEVKARIGNRFFVKVLRIKPNSERAAEFIDKILLLLIREISARGAFKPGLKNFFYYLNQAYEIHPLKREIYSAFIESLGELNPHLSKFVEHVQLTKWTLPFYKDANLDYGRPIKGIIPFFNNKRFKEIDSAFFTGSKLHEAVKEGHLEEAKSLIQQYPLILYTMDEQGNSPLHIAVNEGRHEMVELFVDALEEGYLPVNSAYQTPLHLAILKGDSRMIACLSQDKVKYDAEHRVISSHLMLALAHGSSECVDELLHFEGRFSPTPLFCSNIINHPLLLNAKRGNHVLVQWMKANGMEYRINAAGLSYLCQEIFELEDEPNGIEIFKEIFQVSPHKCWKDQKRLLEELIKEKKIKLIRAFIEAFSDERDCEAVFFEILNNLYFSQQETLLKAIPHWIDMSEVFQKLATHDESLARLILKMAPEKVFKRGDTTLLPRIRKSFGKKVLLDALKELPNESLASYFDDEAFPLLNVVCELGDRDFFKRCFSAMSPSLLEKRLGDGSTIFKELWVDRAIGEGFLEESLVMERVDEALKREGFLYEMDKMGHSPLHWAVEKGNHALAKRMIPYLVDGRLPHRAHCESLLDIAISRRDVAMIEILTQKSLWIEMREEGHFIYVFCALERCPEANIDRLWEFEKASIIKSGQIPNFNPLKYRYELDRCINLRHFSSCLWLIKQGVPFPENRVWQLLEMLIEESETEASLELFRLVILKLSDIDSEKTRECFIKALKHRNEKFAKYFLDRMNLHDPKYSCGSSSKTLPNLEVKLLKSSQEFRVYFFKVAPTTFFYSDTTGSGEKVCLSFKKEALMGRFGLSEEEARIYLLAVEDAVTGLPDDCFFRTLFLACESREDIRRLVDVTLELFYTFPGDRAERKKLYDEFYLHIFSNFRPELLKSEEILDKLLVAWKLCQSKEERALFFNGLQSQVSIEKIHRALLGVRSISDQDADPLDLLAYIEVARYQKGKTLACELYQKRYDDPKIQQAALDALASLAVVLDTSLINLMEEQLRSEKTDPIIQEKIANLFWEIERNPEDERLKEFVYRAFERQICLGKALDLVRLLNVNTESVLPQLLVLSSSPSKEMRIQATFALALLQEETALLRALEIVQSSDWDGYDAFFREEELGHQGNFMLFVRKPRFQDNRSSMVLRICDRLARIRKDDISERVHALAPKAYFTSQSEHSGRYLSSPFYFPRGILVRGICERKGSNLLYEAIRDLIRHGAGKADLSHFGGEFENATWCKIGHIFGTSFHKTAENYGRNAYGLTILYDSSYYNEEFLRGRGRIEVEGGSINNVLYYGIPWPYIQKIYFPESCKRDLMALHSEMPIEELELDSPIFFNLDPVELEEMRFYLRRPIPRIVKGEIVEETTVFDRIAYGDFKSEEEISKGSIYDKSLKRRIQCAEVKKLYRMQTAMQDEILEDFSDEEFALAIPRLLDIFKVGVDQREHLETLKTKHLSPRFKRVARLSALYQGGDLKQLYEKQPLHRAPERDIRLMEALIKGISYEEMIRIEVFPLCSEEEYKELMHCLY